MRVKLASQNQITKDTVILMMALFYPALRDYIWRVVVTFTNIVGFWFSIQAFDAVVWTVIVGYMIITARSPKMSLKAMVIALTFILVSLLSFALTSYDHFTPSVLFSLLLGTVPFFFYGSLIDLKRASHKQLYIAAVFTLVVSIAYSIYSVGTKDLELEDNMDFAYKVLPSVLVVVSWLFTDRKKKLAVILSVAGTIFLVMQGTRGPLLCLAAFICLMLYKKYGIGKLFFRAGAIVVVAVLLVSSQFVQLRLIDLSKKIDSSGYSARFITMMLEGELSDSNGRDAIQDKLLDDIEEEPLKIRGMYADREATRYLVDTEYSTSYANGTYAHSLWLEMIYHWGVILGGLMLLLLTLAVLRLIRKSENSAAYIVMLFVCTGFVQLLLSSSYLLSDNFFFLVGLTVNYYTDKGINESINTKGIVQQLS